MMWQEIRSSILFHLLVHSGECQPADPQPVLAGQALRPQLPQLAARAAQAAPTHVISTHSTLGPALSADLPPLALHLDEVLDIRSLALSDFPAAYLLAIGSTPCLLFER